MEKEVLNIPLSPKPDEDKLVQLSAMMESQRHINKDMRDLLAQIVKMYKTEQERGPQVPLVAKSVASISVQTQGALKRAAKEKPNGPPPKVQIREIGSKEQETNFHKWQLVQKKKGKTVPNLDLIKAPRVKPEAILISKTADKSYAEMLKIIKTKPELQEFGKNVNKIRKTKEGEILIQLTKEAGNLAKDFCNEMKNTLQNCASVKSLTQHTLIECRDLDEITSNEEVRAAIADQFPAINVSDINVKFWRAARDSTRSAIIDLPTKDASVLIAAASVRVGWVRSRIRKHITPMRCFKCLQFGHAARQCKSDNDRSGTCMRCGQDGHRAKTCSAQPKCILCPENCNGGNLHYSRSSKCEFYRKAIKELKSKK
ncbi:uncharacterized protein LOC119666062 [Teleopsis dalmanni]|uniref:uncharacterized protein LOC119666062 n=1 Tax=Teleopsis dalmanni TaxID=139649 RepID=UPI0018CF8A55|nr:uncharacterized protein LOC119666062 [Teleopsis dalmanni]